MRPKDDIERLVQSVRATTSAAVDEHILSDATEALAHAVQRQSAGRPSIFRTGIRTMQRHWKPAAAAFAAAVIIAVMLVVFQNSASPAYAIEQTVRASHTVRTIHFRLEDFQSKETPMDIWARFDDAGQLLQCRVDSQTEEGPKQGVWQDNRAEMLLVKRNMYAVAEDQVVANRMRDFVQEFDPRQVVSQLQQLQLQGQVQLEVQAAADDAEPIIVTATFLPGTHLAGSQSLLKIDPDRVVFRVDPQTRLVSMLTMYKCENGEYRRLGDVRFLEYNQPVDQAMFKLQVPADALVADQWSQEAGLAQGDMTEQQVAAEVVRRFFDALIAKDYAAAGRLYHGFNAAAIEKMYGKGKFNRILSIGEPEPAPKVNGLRVPCVVAVECEGKVQQVSRNVYVNRVHLHPECWTICGGI